MDDPNITMEQYIQLEEEKARRRGKVYNWETATYGKIWYDEDVHTTDFENEFLAIVYNDALTSKLDFLTEPTISPQHIDEFNLKDETSLSECDEEEQNVLYFNDVFPFNVKMDDPNITMEQYIQLEEEKARRRGKVYNWETATYGKIWYDEDVHTTDLLKLNS
nr:hypothetical protein [Tanacetum cinerariifolium]